MILLLLFLILVAILLPGLMRFFFAMIGLFVIVMLTLAVAHAEPAESDCDPAFVGMNATLTYATTKCDKNYMDTSIGIDAMELAHKCDAVLGKKKIHAIMITAMRDFDTDVREKGKAGACAIVDKAFEAIGAAVGN